MVKHILLGSVKKKGFVIRAIALIFMTAPILVEANEGGCVNATLFAKNSSPEVKIEESSTGSYEITAIHKKDGYEVGTIVLSIYTEYAGQGQHVRVPVAFDIIGANVETRVTVESAHADTEFAVDIRYERHDVADCGRVISGYFGNLENLL